MPALDSRRSSWHIHLKSLDLGTISPWALGRITDWKELLVKSESLSLHLFIPVNLSENYPGMGHYNYFSNCAKKRCWLSPCLLVYGTLYLMISFS